MRTFLRTLPARVFAAARAVADSLIDWMYQNGQVDTLAALTTNTAAVRGAVLSAASMAVAHGYLKGSPPELAVSAVVLAATWLLNGFVQYARRRHNAEVQLAVVDAGIPLKVDGCIGAQTVAAVKAAINAPPPTPPVR